MSYNAPRLVEPQLSRPPPYEQYSDEDSDSEYSDCECECICSDLHTNWDVVSRVDLEDTPSGYTSQKYGSFPGHQTTVMKRMAELMEDLLDERVEEQMEEQMEEWKGRKEKLLGYRMEKLLGERVVKWNEEQGNFRDWLMASGAVYLLTILVVIYLTM